MRICLGQVVAPTSVQCVLLPEYIHSLLGVAKLLKTGENNILAAMVDAAYAASIGRWAAKDEDTTK